MSGTSRRDRILAIVATDATFALASQGDERVWLGKCIFCGRKLAVSERGELLGSATVEHIVPRNHGGTDDVANLALACARCNREKGKRHDARARPDSRAREVIERLQQRRRQRWRDL